MPPFITIAGNIGVGKSTLVTLLCQRLGWEPVLEAVAENPYLTDFYTDMHRWSFHSQIYFLARRLQQHHDLLQQPSPVIQDRSVYEDAEIFARNLRASLPTLQRRIAHRGRPYEQSIPPTYLTQLNHLYDQWAATFTLSPILTVETDNLDYVQNDHHLDQIWQRIDHRLHGRDHLTLT